MVKIFTMVKGEADIVREWIMYHGYLFGFHNLFVIDNMSRDGTWEIINEFKNKINIFRSTNYKLKGDYMTLLINKHCKDEIAFPIDIDEFIVMYDNKINKISCEKNDIYNYITNLPKREIYKMNYIQSKITNENGYFNAPVESMYGSYEDCNDRAKTFVLSSLFKSKLDHGNHYTTNNYLMSNICLVHYHCRNIEQMRKKIYNNVNGLGYPVFNKTQLQQLLLKNKHCDGYHHVNNQIQILSNTYKVPISTYYKTDIVLEPLSTKIKTLSL
jgi:hypothetical protein